MSDDERMDISPAATPPAPTSAPKDWRLPTPTPDNPYQSGARAEASCCGDGLDDDYAEWTKPKYADEPEILENKEVDWHDREARFTEIIQVYKARMKAARGAHKSDEAVKWEKLHTHFSLEKLKEGRRERNKDVAVVRHSGYSTTTGRFCHAAEPRLSSNETSSSSSSRSFDDLLRQPPWDTIVPPPSLSSGLHPRSRSQAVAPLSLGPIRSRTGHDARSRSPARSIPYSRRARSRSPVRASSSWTLTSSSRPSQVPTPRSRDSERGPPHTLLTESSSNKTMLYAQVAEDGADILVGRVLGLHEFFDIRALNVSVVPEPVTGEIDLFMRDNGRFGREDHLQWPQYFCPSLPFLAFIPQRPRATHPAAVLWQVPQRSDFVRANNHPQGEAFGLLKPEVLSTLDQAISILPQLISSFRNAAQHKLAELDEFERSAGSGSLPLDLIMRKDGLECKLAEVGDLEARLILARAVFAGPTTFTMTLLQWGHLHRCFAECWAWLQLQQVHYPTQKLHPGLDGSGVMGVYCDNNHDALRMCHLGVPVWLIVPKKAAPSRLPTKAQEPLKAQDRGIVLTKDLVPFSIHRRVMVGCGHANSLRQLSSSVFDYEKISVFKQLRPLDERPAAPTSSLARVRETAAQNTVSGGLERIPEKIHDLLPRRLTIWQEALSSVDTTVPVPDDRLGIWLPHAEFVVSVKTNRRLFVYLSNWLRYRCAVLSSLLNASQYAPPRPNHWRTLLARFPPTALEPGEVQQSQRRKTKPGGNAGQGDQTAKRRLEKEEACEFFGELFHEKITLEVNLPDAVNWRGLTLPREAFEIAELGQFRRFIQEIAWELSEVAFRIELQELDRFLVPSTTKQTNLFELQRRDLLVEVFSDGHHLLPSLPPTNTLFDARDPQKRAQSLDALRRLLCRWDRHPAHFDALNFNVSGVSEVGLASFEREAATFYCQRFYEWAGRPPVMPRMIPN